MFCRAQASVLSPYQRSAEPVPVNQQFKLTVRVLAIMLAAKFIIIRRMEKVDRLRRLALAVHKTNIRKRGVGRVEGRVDLDMVPDEGWRSQFRYILRSSF